MKLNAVAFSLTFLALCLSPLVSQGMTTTKTHTLRGHHAHHHHHAALLQLRGSDAGARDVKDDDADDDSDDAKEDDAKEDAADDAKEDAKEEAKEDAKEDAKEEAKEEAKEGAAKEETKEEAKEEAKKEEAKKEEAAKEEASDEEDSADDEEEDDDDDGEEEKSKAEVKLGEAKLKETKLEAQLDALKKENYEAKIDAEVAKVKEETQTTALAEMLGDMRKEMHQFAVPFFKEHLEEKLEKVEKKEKKLEKEVAKEQKEEKKDGGEKKESKEEEKKAAAAAPAAEKGGTTKYEPMFTEKTMPAVSPTLQCVISLSVQYFVVYTALAVLRTMNEFTDGSVLGMQKICEVACTTVTYAPMLSVLFIGTRMRAIQLTQGETEKYKLPQPWAQTAMYIATYAVLVQVLLVLVIPIFTGETEMQADEDGNVDVSDVEMNPVVAIALSVARYVAMLMLYGGFTTVCVGVFTMKAPEEIWGDKPPPVSPAVACTINLSVQFFLVYLVVAIVRTMIQLGGPTPFKTKLEGVFKMAKFTVNFAPMLCILFIGARMRALQIDPKHGNPQKWAQNCFFLCTYSVLIQTLLVIILPLIMDCRCKQGDSEGDVVFEGLNSTVNLAITVIRYIALLALYGGFSAVVVSIFLIKNEKDPSLTPPISPAMQCVINLTVQYFFVYLCLFVFITLKQFTGGFSVVIALFEAGQKTVMFAPMLSILFVGARMRALQLTKATDGTIPPSAGPQTWAQQAMFLATWSVLVQLIMVLVIPLFVGGGGKPEVDEDGNLIPPPGTNYMVAIVLSVIRYLCLISMYGGAVTVMVAVYSMAPERLPPYAGYEQLVPGVDVPTPPTPPPAPDM